VHVVFGLIGFFECFSVEPYSLNLFFLNETLFFVQYFLDYVEDASETETSMILLFV